MVGSLEDRLAVVVASMVRKLGLGAAAVSVPAPDGLFDTLAVAGSVRARALVLPDADPSRRPPRASLRSSFAGAITSVWPARLAASGIGEGSERRRDSAADWCDGPSCRFDFVRARPWSSTCRGRCGVIGRPARAYRRDDRAAPTPPGLNAERESVRALREELRIGKHAFNLAFEEAVIGTSLISLDEKDAGRFQRVNAAFCRMTGYSPERLTTLSLSDLTHPEDRGTDDSALRRAMAGRRTPFGGHKRYITAEGEPIWVQVTASPLFDDDGNAMYAIVQVQDLRPRGDHQSEFAAARDAGTGLLTRARTRGNTDGHDRARTAP